MIQNNIIDFVNATQITAVQVDQKIQSIFQDANKADGTFKYTLSNNDRNKKFVRINDLIHLKNESKTERLCIANDNMLKLAMLHNYPRLLTQVR